MHISPDPDRRPRSEQRPRFGVLWAIAAVLAVAGGAYVYTRQEPAEVEPAPPTPQIEPQPAAPAPEPQPVEEVAPVPVPAQTAPLPALNESDAAVSDALAGLVGRETATQILQPPEIIRRIVATVDNLPRDKLALRLWPIMPSAGKFMTSGQEGNVTLNPENARRYAPLIRLVGAVDTAKLAGTYFRFYPLFQQAYADLGYPQKQFNQRLLEVIDHLLATPEVKGTIKLVQPAVYYKFADAALESKSAGQKTLIRIGPDNAAIIKNKLREFRQAISARPAAN